MRRKSEVLTALFFFIIVVSLFPLGIGPETALLRKIAPGILWVAALLATMLGLARLFAPDHADGTLEQMVLSPTPLGLLITGKIVAHWLTTGLPLVLLAPVLGIQFDLDTGALGILMIALLLGTPLLSLIGAIGAALDARRARWWCLVVFAGVATICSDTDLWRRCGRSAYRRPGRRRAFVAVGRAAGAGGFFRAVGNHGCFEDCT